MPDDHEAHDCHSRFYLALLNDREPALHSHAQLPTLRGLIVEIDNLRAAWDWATTRRLFDARVPALRAFGCLFELSGWLEEGEQLLEAAIRAVGAGRAEPQGRRLVGEALAQQAVLLMCQGHFGSSLARANESLALVRPLADPDLLVRPLLYRSIIQHLTTQLDESEAAVVESRACALQGDAERVRAYLDQSLAVHRGFVAGWDIVRSLLYLGQAARVLGDADAAPTTRRGAGRGRGIESAVAGGRGAGGVGAD